MARITSLDRRGRLRTSESVAGWVFADMLLVLFIIGLGAAFMLPKPPPTPPEKPEIIGMETAPVSVSIRVNAAALSGGGSEARAARRAVCATIRQATRPQTRANDRAALVLIFGGGPEPSPGQAVASAIGSQLFCASRSVFERGTPFRSFWDGGLQYGEARLEIFLFTTEAS